MSSLQSYYGLSSQRGDGMDLSTLMSLYDGRRDEHVTPLPPCLSVTRVEADIVAVATTDAEMST